MSSDDWKSKVFRESIVQKINDKILATCDNIVIDATQMENKIFHMASSREEYFAIIAKFIIYVREKNRQASSNSNIVKTEINNDFFDRIQQKKLPTKAGNQPPAVVVQNNGKRPEPTCMQKLQIHKNAISSAIHSKNWQISSSDDKQMDLELDLFGQFVASKLSEITNEELRINVQQQILSLLNK